MSGDELGLVTAALERAGIAHMLTGSFAAAWYGAARATLDFDLVIDASGYQLRRFVESFNPAEYYVSLDAALQALAHQSQFNVIALESGWKVDLIIRKARPFSRMEFDRRIQVEIGGKTHWIVSPEDLVIAKLEWAHRGGSARQIEDVARLLTVRGDELDAAYLAHWIAELGLDAEWDAARTHASPDR